MEIKLGNISNLDDILEIENESFIHPWTRNNWIEEINTNPTMLLLVAIIDNKVVGFLDTWVTFDTSSIAQIAIRKSYRRNHIAESLFKELEKRLIEMNVEYITLEVRKSNIIAQKFYEKMGFSSIVIKPQYYDNGEDAIYMVKELMLCQ